MALMMGKLYSALRAAGSPEDDATKAAEEAAGFENRLAALAADLLAVKWMVGFILAIVLAIAAKLFFPH